MVNHLQTEQQATALRHHETSLAGKFFAWLGTELRNRHEATLRRRNLTVCLRPVNPTPV